jgi:hypothetical protein
MAVLSSSQSEQPGSYFTNEAFLYRVVGVAVGATGEIVELEDCYSLDVVRVPLDTFRACRLRVVAATDAGPCPSGF